MEAGWHFEARKALSVGGWLGWALGFGLGLVLLSRPVRAQEVDYSDVDRSTVRVLALGGVNVETLVRDDRRRLQLAVPVMGHGTGFVVSAHGVVVTAAHVVAGARALAVQVPGRPQPMPARVLRLDEEHDVAFLQAEGPFEHLARLAPPDARLRIRASVFAIGYPLDATRPDPQSSRGVISGLLPDGRLQLAISVNPGNSGGPVIDEAELVHGLISKGSDPTKGAEGLGIAIPLASFRKDLDEVLATAADESAPAPFGEEDHKLADMVALLTTGSSQVMESSLKRDSREVRAAEQEVERMLAGLKDSSEAALLGAAFYFNRFVAESEGRRDATELRRNLLRAKELGVRAVHLEAALKRSPFIQRLAQEPTPVAEAAAPARWESRAGTRALGWVLAVGTFPAVMVSFLATSECRRDGCAGAEVLVFAAVPLVLVGTVGGVALARIPDKPIVEPTARGGGYLKGTPALVYTGTF